MLRHGAKAGARPSHWPSPIEITRIARKAGISVPGVYARLRVGDWGRALTRPGERRGKAPTPAPAPKVAARPAPTRASELSTGWELLQLAAARGITPELVRARIDARWPADRLLDPPQKRRRRW
jgi:hypothetical protein